MHSKERLRKKFLSIRKKKYFEIKPDFFKPLSNLLKNYKKNVFISSYYPSNFEVNSLKLFDTRLSKELKMLLPVVTKNNSMQFFQWKINDVLKVNKFGMVEPVIHSSHIVPKVMLVPLLAYDQRNFRLGYGGGFYDRYLNKYLTQHKKILTIGIAFSFQKYHKLPVNEKDVKLNYILTEKGIV